MVKVKIFSSNEVIEVTQNVAHGLIERGEGEIYTGRGRVGYKTRQMSVSRERIAPKIAYTKTKKEKSKKSRGKYSSR